MDEVKQPVYYVLMLGPKCYVYGYDNGMLTLTRTHKNAWACGTTSILYQRKALILKVFGIQSAVVPLENITRR